MEVGVHGGVEVGVCEVGVCEVGDHSRNFVDMKCDYNVYCCNHSPAHNSIMSCDTLTD